MIRALHFLLIIFSPYTFATAEPNFRFEYVPMEMQRTTCAHRRIRDLPDWEVTCDTRFGRKVFVAHVVFRETHHQRNSSLEIIYWVTDRSKSFVGSPQFHSTTALMHFKQKTEPLMMTLAQGVENDSAYLNLNWRRD